MIIKSTARSYKQLRASVWKNRKYLKNFDVTYRVRALIAFVFEYAKVASANVLKAVIARRSHNVSYARSSSTLCRDLVPTKTKFNAVVDTSP